MNQSLVSIIVPVYNTAEYVEECIQSILSQSYKSIELVIVNDGSKDGSGDICKRYIQLPNVSYIEQENSGTTVARKKGVEESHGEWIMFVDSDDYIYKDAIETMISKSVGVDIVVASDQRKNLRNENDIIDRYTYFKRMYQRQFSCTISPKLFRKAILNKESFNIPRNLIWGEDFLFNLLIAKNNTRPVHVCQSPMYFYRDNPSSSCHTFNYPLDYYIQLTDFADRIVNGSLSKDEQVRSSSIMRLQFYKFLLNHFLFKIDKKHPYVQDTKKRLLDSGNCKLSDLLLLNYPSKAIYKISRIVARFENPILLVRDCKKMCGFLK